MEKNKGLVVSVIVLLIAVLLLGGYIIYDKFFDNKSDNKVITEKIIKDNKSEMKYEIANIKGYYTYENGKNTSESEYEKYELTLLDNGLFVYTLENVASNTIIGNYYIDGNNIILNYLYDSGIIGGPSLLTISGSRTINVSGDNLIDNNRSIVPNMKSMNKLLQGLDHGKSMIVGMIDYGTCGIENLLPAKESCLDGIRVIFKKHHMSEALAFCKKIKDFYQ